MIDDDDFDFNQPVTRIAQNPHSKKQLEHNILKDAEVYLEQISASEHGYLIQTLTDLGQQDAYFNVLAQELDQPVGAKVANDALNLLHFWQAVHQHDDAAAFNLLETVNSEFFQKALLQAFDALQIDEALKAQRRKVLLESFKMYKLGFSSGCVPSLYAQLEGILTDVLIANGFLKQHGAKFLDVYKIVPGLKGNEIKSLWHKSKIAAEMNGYFTELEAYKMDTSSSVSQTRHNILHGTDTENFNQGRSFILFIWLFSAVSFMSGIKP